MLILDGHESRLDIDCLEAARDAGVHIFLLPGNCTAFMQPMDQWYGASSTSGFCIKLFVPVLSSLTCLQVA